jgi:hypothetical protein
VYSATPAPEDAQQAKERRLGAVPDRRRWVAADPERKSILISSEKKNL